MHDSCMASQQQLIGSLPSKWVARQNDVESACAFFEQTVCVLPAINYPNGGNIDFRSHALGGRVRFNGKTDVSAVSFGRDVLFSGAITFAGSASDGIVSDNAQTSLLGFDWFRRITVEGNVSAGLSASGNVNMLLANVSFANNQVGLSVDHGAGTSQVVMLGGIDFDSNEIAAEFVSPADPAVCGQPLSPGGLEVMMQRSDGSSFNRPSFIVNNEAGFLLSGQTSLVATGQPLVFSGNEGVPGRAIILDSADQSFFILDGILAYENGQRSPIPQTRGGAFPYLVLHEGCRDAVISSSTFSDNTADYLFAPPSTNYPNPTFGELIISNSIVARNMAGQVSLSGTVYVDSSGQQVNDVDRIDMSSTLFYGNQSGHGANYSQLPFLSFPDPEVNPDQALLSALNCPSGYQYDYECNSVLPSGVWSTYRNDVYRARSVSAPVVSSPFPHLMFGFWSPSSVDGCSAEGYGILGASGLPTLQEVDLGFHSPVDSCDATSACVATPCTPGQVTNCCLAGDSTPCCVSP